MRTEPGPVSPLRLTGYSITRTLRESSACRVYAAVRERDARPVVIKLHPFARSEGVESRVEHEFRLIQALEVDGVVEAIALERVGDELALILADSDGIDLAEYGRQRPLPTAELVEIATEVARILTDIHAHKIIHRDIKPSNIMINPRTRRVSIVDFGISVLLAHRSERINDPEIITGTLPYLSPEQTGRTKHQVDFRSDLYSLGVTLYELATGRRPFEAKTPLALIHAHLAQRPKPPVRLQPELPLPISALVMKLLEKAPERRYQSARGLHADLCRLRSILDSGASLDDFELGLEDVPSVLQLPHRLYGRESEIERLTAAWRVASEGQSRFVLITGALGVGKSSLIEQLVEPSVSRDGLLIRGGIDRHGQPYAALVAAFTDLADQLLTQSDEQLARWRRTLRRELAGLAPVISQQVPRLAAIIDDDDVAPELGALESRNRLALAWGRLIAIFARPEHPLVLALDDLHRADAPTCDLIASVSVEPDLALLLVGALREDELSRGHPARALVDHARDSPTATHIELGALDTASLTAWLADTLASPPEQVRPLAELVGREGDYNPLFVRQLLEQLFELELLRPTADGWSWDAEGLDATSVPEDLLTMMAAKLDALEPAELELASAAATLGIEFELELLAATVAPHSIPAPLARLIDEGLITPTQGDRYRFTHARIRDVAYELASPERRVELHGKIGELWLERMAHGHEDVPLFDVVEHLDISHGFIALEDESPADARARAVATVASLDLGGRAYLSELNLLAGKRVLASTPPQAADYFDAALQLLDEGTFPQPEHPTHALRVAAELGRAQASGLSGDRIDADERFGRMLDAPLTVTDIGEVVSSRVEMRIQANDRPGGLACGLAGLAMLEIELLSSPPVPTLISLLRSSELTSLRTRPALSDPRIAAAMEILTVTIPAAQLTDRPTFARILATQVSLSIEHGPHPLTSLGLCHAALVIGKMVGDHHLALGVGELALTLAKPDDPKARTHRMDVLYWLSASWIKPHNAGLPGLREAIERALSAGDLEFAGYTIAIHLLTSLSAGVHLRTVERMAESAAHRVLQWLPGPIAQVVARHLDFARAMVEPDPGFLERARSDFAFAKGPTLHMCLQLRARLNYLLERPDLALRDLEQQAETPDGPFGGWHPSDSALFHGLSAAAVASEEEAESERREQLIAVVQAQRDKFVGWSKFTDPTNCEPHIAVLEAELCALSGPGLEALARYAEARALAETHENLMLEAISLERMAKLALSHGLRDLAIGPIREARARYHHWGAFTKVALLEQRWPQLREPTQPKDTSGDSTTTSTTAGQALDLATVLKASQTITEDIRLEDVVTRVMAIAIENAGAERGALLLPTPDGLELIADRTEFLAQRLPVDSLATQLPLSVIHWVERTREATVLDDVSTHRRFGTDPYVELSGVRSVLCLPIIKYSRLIGVLYLENRLSSGGFTKDRLELLSVLMAQAASALENAQLFEALRTSEIRWRSLVEGLPDVVILVDRRGRVEFINHLEDDEQRGDIVGAEVASFIHEHDVVALRDDLSVAVERGHSAQLQLRATLGSERMRWFDLRLAPISVDGRVTRVIVVGTDVTERREAAEANLALEAQLRQQQRLESIGTLASGVAHEINNPIQGIMNYAELICMRAEVDEEVREFVGEIRYESERVATIVHNLLAFSRVDSHARPHVVAVDRLIKDTLSLIRALARKDGIQFDVETDDDVPPLECRTQQIQQVLMNLVTNARDALVARWDGFHERKRIEIRACRFEESSEASAVPWVRVSVSDEGGGIAPENEGRIFDPFFTTKGRDQGTGLGLSISHGIVQDHGGRLRLDNRPGVGACFHIELPCQPPAPS